MFPPIAEILDNLSPNSSAAFCPQYAIALDDFDTFRLFRRNTLVGTINEKGIVLSSASRCYSEELSEIETVNVEIQ